MNSSAQPVVPPVLRFAYRRSVDHDCPSPARHRVVIVGAGPVGLALAIDLALRGVQVVVLDESDRIGDGSRAICFAKRTLEIFGRLGVADPLLARGIEWRVGKVFQGTDLLYQFDLLPEGGHRMPAFINIQQYHVEAALVARAQALGVDLRWLTKVTALEPDVDHVGVVAQTPDGPLHLSADWLVACDGARSPCRQMLGLAFEGEQFEDQFLIADVRMRADFPTERWFWFDPPFHDGQSCLLHRQPDDIWRIDLQLSPKADAAQERRPEVVRPRIERMLGHADFDLEWVSIYRFQCRRLSRFVHGRVVFAGDAAHQVSPFGARGANSGIQDADNLGWKLAAVLAGEAPQALIDSYDIERGAAADDNIMHSTRATDFIAPRSLAERQFRDAALALARRAPFARRFVNSGRLSQPTSYAPGSLCTPDDTSWISGPPPGAPLPDLPLSRGSDTHTYLSAVLPAGFAWLQFGGDLPDLPQGVAGLLIGRGGWNDPEGLAMARFGAAAGAGYLVRPDGHVAARFHHPGAGSIRRAFGRALGRADLSREAAA